MKRRKLSRGDRRIAGGFSESAAGAGVGYSGVALKACKGQTNALLMGAAAQKFGMFTCVQDLTCPGASLLQSVAWLPISPPLPRSKATPGNTCLRRTHGWAAIFPGIFRPENGMFQTCRRKRSGIGNRGMMKLSERSPRSRNRLGLSVAARNFGDIPIRTSLEKIAEYRIRYLRQFRLAGPRLFAEYKALLKKFDLGAGFLWSIRNPM